MNVQEVRINNKRKYMLLDEQGMPIVPVGCKLYDKTQTKLELAVEMIETVANELTE